VINPLLSFVLAGFSVVICIDGSGRAQTQTGPEIRAAAEAGATSAPATHRDIVWRAVAPNDEWYGDAAGVIAFGPTDRGPLSLALLENSAVLSAASGGQALLRSLAATITQGFDPSWNGKTSPNGLWRINGLWPGTGANILDPSLARIVSSYPGLANGALLLSVAAKEKRGSEIQTLVGVSYGYYEVRMRVTDVPGVCASFFWIEAPNYGPHEWDLEFLTNESWITSTASGQVHLTLHPSNSAFTLPLAFNPSSGFHRYGFLWSPGKIVFTVDGRAAHAFAEADLATSAKGFIMMNTWTGNRDWGGGPPTQKATTAYEWVKFTADATDIPTE
jgi:hypothetical protein